MTSETIGQGDGSRTLARLVRWPGWWVLALSAGYFAALLWGGIETDVQSHAVFVQNMAAGTAAGGWRIMHTVGQKISRLDPGHGFAAETSSAIVILSAGHFGMPISTTQTITASIFGVASSRRLSAVRWSVGLANRDQFSARGRFLRHCHARNEWLRRGVAAQVISGHKTNCLGRRYRIR